VLVAFLVIGAAVAVMGLSALRSREVENVLHDMYGRRQFPKGGEADFVRTGKIAVGTMGAIGATVALIALVRLILP
jgi:hypothetical protein